MKKVAFIILLLSQYLFSCRNSRENTADRSELARTFFEAVYTGQLDKADSLMADSMISSYAIFQQMINKSTLKGREAYLSFQEGFNERWKDRSVFIHETIAEERDVCIMWSFSATWANLDTSIRVPFEFGKEYSWGGISIVSFDDSDKVIREVGEESNPGPFSRLSK